MKKYKQNNGFTLVELVVVITILAILSTVAFTSFQWYTKSARNVQRIDAISKVATTIQANITAGKPILAFSKSWQEVIWAKISGSIPIVWVNYKAGELEPGPLGIKIEEFTDPLFNEVYRSGVTNIGQPSFEVAATLEEGSWKIAKIIWPWTPRSTSSISATGTSGNSKVLLWNVGQINSLYVWDTIQWIGIGTGTKVESISTNGINIFLDQPLIWNPTNIQLVEDEVSSLIASSWNPIIPSTNTTFNVPYASDTSILLDSTPFLQNAGWATEDVWNDAKTDRAGNSYIAWYFDNWSNNNDILISKFDSLWTELWIKTIWSTGDDQAISLAVDTIGNIYVTGYFNGTVDFWGTILSSFGSNDIYVIKLDNNGNTQWAKQMWWTSADRWYGIGLTPDSSILVTGYFWGTATFWSITHTSSSSSSAFATKIDNSGNIIWATQLDGISVDEGNYITSDSEWNVIVTWFFNGDAQHWSISLINSWDSDTFVTKLAPNGDVIWANKLGGIWRDRATWVVTDTNNDIYVEWFFNNDSQHGTTLLNHAGSNDVFVTKVSSIGDIVWSIALQWWSNDTGNSIDIWPNNNIYVSGYFWWTSTHGSETITSNGNVDVFVTKITPAGGVIWARSIWWASDDRGFGISVDSIWNSYTTWYFNGSITLGSSTIWSAWWRDVFIVKLDTNGDAF